MGTGRKQRKRTRVKESKTCSVCKQLKALSEFYTDLRKKDGRTACCRVCKNESGRVYTAAWRKNNPDSSKASGVRTKLRYKYGLTEDDIYALMQKQDEKCAICGESLSWEATTKKNKPHIDHNHDTGQVRGLLCLTCNTGLGMFGDSDSLLSQAQSYLRSFSGSVND